MDVIDNFDEISVLPEVETVKRCIREIALLGEKAGAPISQIDSNLEKDMSDLSYNMLCYHKQKKKSFTVCDNKELKHMRISEDEDGFAEEDNLRIYEFLHDNLDAFCELVACSYLPKQPKDSAHLSHLFFADIYSRYNGKTNPVFFANSKGKLFVFDSELTQVLLTEYISNYFSATTKVNEEIQALNDVAMSDISFSKMQKQINEKIKVFNDRMLNEHGFTSGVITFMDFLAWKGLWRSQEPYTSLKDVSDLIADFRTTLNELSGAFYSQTAGIQLSSLISISDTIAIFTPKTSSADVHKLLEIHAQLAKYILENCAQHEYPIRGAIAFGDYSIMNNIMIGPGIDECASWHETGNWIGVHLTPTAQIYWEEDTLVTSDVICPYCVPLKGGKHAEYCVKWNISNDIWRKVELKSKALLPEISDKYSNTTKFFKYLSAQPKGGDDNGKR